MVSIGLPIYNGERFIREALDSILAQTFSDFDLIISDNASTDSTARLCAEYAARDCRIRYIRQTENRGILENTAFVMSEVAGKYFMLVGDDDIYDKNYLATMVGLLEGSEEIALAYSNYAYITERGEKQNHLDLSMNPKPTDSKFFNLSRFILRRSCLPMMMGLFRTELLWRALPMPYKELRPMTGDVDNVFLAKLLTMGKVSSTSQPLFWYRLKDRSSAFPADWPKGFFRQQLYLIRHNARVAKLIGKAINVSDLSADQRGMLLVWNWLVFMLLVPLSTFRRLKVAYGSMG